MILFPALGVVSSHFLGLESQCKGRRLEFGMRMGTSSKLCCVIFPRSGIQGDWEAGLHHCRSKCNLILYFVWHVEPN